MAGRKNRINLIILLLVTCFGCKKEAGEIIMRVNYHTVTCTGVGPGTCLLVQTGEKLNSDQWEYFYFDNSIQGFDYEPGYIYTLSVDMEKITNPPADASDTKYTLIKILAKEKVN